MNKERLIKLANHLLTGELMHEVFDFSRYNGNFSAAKFNEIGCATNGCAIGECPKAFAEDWEFRPAKYRSDDDYSIIYLPVLKDLELEHPVNFTTVELSARRYFELSNREFSVLFVPHYSLDDEETDEDDYIDIGNETIFSLRESATKEEVANNILRFVELCK